MKMNINVRILLMCESVQQARKSKQKVIVNDICSKSSRVTLVNST